MPKIVQWSERPGATPATGVGTVRDSVGRAAGLRAKRPRTGPSAGKSRPPGRRRREARAGGRARFGPGSVGRRLAPRLLSAAAAVGLLRGRQPGLYARRRDVQLATGPPPFVRDHRHRQQIAVLVRHHGRHAVNTNARRAGYYYDRYSIIDTKSLIILSCTVSVVMEIGTGSTWIRGYGFAEQPRHWVVGTRWRK